MTMSSLELGSLLRSPDRLLEYLFDRALHIHGEAATITHVHAFRFRLEVSGRYYEGTLAAIAHWLMCGDVGTAISRQA